ncbi:hypothetical protein [Microbaculum sp. FT89]|uniref:hypothetical protein n=1 Tax=Microbaculum sp. FT89 TaxID=3447298 RepID=UPI003F53A6E1
MTQTQSQPSFGARFGRTIGNLLLALINATLLLFIVAAISGIVLIGKVRTFSTDIAGDVTEAAIASTGLNPADALAELRVASTEIAELRAAIGERRSDIDARVDALGVRLDTMQNTLQSLRERKIAITDAVIDKAATAAGNALKDLRDCRPADAGS